MYIAYMKFLELQTNMKYVFKMEIYYQDVIIKNVIL